MAEDTRGATDPKEDPTTLHESELVLYITLRPNGSIEWP